MAPITIIVIIAATIVLALLVYFTPIKKKRYVYLFVYECGCETHFKGMIEIKADCKIDSYDLLIKVKKSIEDEGHETVVITNFALLRKESI